MNFKFLYFIAILCSFEGFAQQYIFEGKITPGFRSYVSHIDRDTIFAEAGGTSTKMGGDYQLLFRNPSVIDNRKVIASSTDGKSYLYTKRRKLFYVQTNSVETKRFKLKKVLEDKDTDRIRYNIFQRYYWSEHMDHQKLYKKI